MLFNLFLYITGISNALLIELETLVHAQFAEDEPLEWIEAYYGTLERTFPFVLVIGRHGNEVKGIYQYKNYVHKFVVEGEWRDHEIQLLEWDNNDQLAGYMRLEHWEKGFLGKWYNVSRELQMEVELISIENIDNWDWPVRQGWIKKFVGRFSKGRVELLLQKDRNLYFGIMKTPGENQDYFVSGQCSEIDCNTAQLNLTDESGELIGTLNTQFIQNRIANVSFDMINLPLEYFTLVQTTKLNLEIESQLQYCRLIDHSVPGPLELNQAVTSYYNTQTKNDVILESIPDNRFQVRQYGWQNIFYLSDRIYSAALFIQEQDSHSANTMILNFDRKKEERIQISSLFKRRINHTELFSTKIASKLSEMELNTLKVEDFKHIGFTDRGFLVATEYDVIKGQHKLILPYNLFEDQLAKGSLIELFIK